MADLIFNISKGRGVELHNRVKLGDPSTARFTVVPVDVAAVSDATLRDFDTLALILAGGVTERSTSNWNRKTIAAADLTTFTPDDANDRADVDMADTPLLWTPGPTAGAVTDLILCYNPTAGADSTLVPVALYDFAITPDGSDVQATVNTAGYLRAA